MSDQHPPDNPSEGSSEPKPIGAGGQFAQQVRHRQLSARVPESVGRGVFASTSLVITGSHEFVIDFIQSVTRPQQVAQRIALPPSIMPNLLAALRQNIENYEKRFGAIPELPRPPAGAKPPSIEEIYDQLKLPEEVAGGVYANTVMITHAQSEFCFDFITSFYPRATVGARIYMAAPQVPRLLQTLGQSFEQYKQRVAAMQQQHRAAQAASPPPPPPDSTTDTTSTQPDPDSDAGRREDSAEN